MGSQVSDLESSQWRHPNTVSYPKSKPSPPSCRPPSERIHPAPCNYAAAGNACMPTNWPCVLVTGRQCPWAEAQFRPGEEHISRLSAGRCWHFPHESLSLRPIGTVDCLRLPCSSGLLFSPYSG